MVKVAVKVMLGTSLKAPGLRDRHVQNASNLVAIKAPVFSMSKLGRGGHAPRAGDEIYR